MFERYTEKARRVIFFARYEASQFGSPAIEAEHILLGLLREDKELTNRFFPRPQGSIESIRKEIEGRMVVRKMISTSVDLPLSTTAKRVLGFAQEESERLRHPYIGTEDLLLGLLREEKSLAAEILYERGLRLNHVRDELRRMSPAKPPGFIERMTRHFTGAPTATMGTGLEAEAPDIFVTAALYNTAFGCYAPRLQRALYLARCAAGEMGAAAVGPEHLLLGALVVIEEESKSVPVRLAGSFEPVKDEVVRRTEQQQPVPIEVALPFSAAALRALAAAQGEVERPVAWPVDLVDLLAGLLAEEGSLAAELLAARGVTLDALRRMLGRGDNGERDDA